LSGSPLDCGSQIESDVVVGMSDVLLPFSAFFSESGLGWPSVDKK